MTDKLFVQIDDVKIELKGSEKESYYKLLDKDKKEALLLEAEYKAKQEARENAIKKLAEVAGLTKEELASIL